MNFYWSDRTDLLYANPNCYRTLWLCQINNNRLIMVLCVSSAHELSQLLSATPRLRKIYEFLYLNTTPLKILSNYNSNIICTNQSHNFFRCNSIPTLVQKNMYFCMLRKLNFPRRRWKNEINNVNKHCFSNMAFMVEREKAFRCHYSNQRKLDEHVIWSSIISPTQHH